MPLNRRWNSIYVMLTALAVQIALLSLSMPISDLATGNWFFNIDNPYHIYQLGQGEALWRLGRLTGYDPYFGAGTLGGLATNVSARFSLFVAAMLPQATPPATAYAAYVFLCSLAPVFAIWALGRMLKWSQWQAGFALILGLLLWWVGVFRWYHTAGMVSFVAACYLAIPFAVWSFSVCSAGQRLRPTVIPLVGLVGGAGMWLHPLFCIPVAILFLSLIPTSRTSIRVPIFVARAASIALIVVALCLPWVLALVNASGPQYPSQQPYQRAVGLGVLIQSLGFGAGGATGATINLLILGACIFGAWTMRRRMDHAVLPFVFAGLALLVFSAFAGANETLAYVQPNRFLGPAYLLLAVATSYYLPAAIGRVRSERRTPAKLGLLLVGIASALFFGRELFREISSGDHGRHGKAPPEISAAPAIVLRLEQWIAANTTVDGRILFQVSLGRVHGGGHVAGYLAARTKREFMGAAYPYYQAQTSCWDKFCFGRPIADISPEDFQRILVAYNTHWIIAHSDELKQLIQRIPAIKKVAEFDNLSMYELGGVKNFVESGNGRVVGREFNRVEVAGASGPALILRYNWLPGLVTVPPSTIEPYVWSAGFPPLIRIVKPPANFVLRLAD